MQSVAPQFISEINLSLFSIHGHTNTSLTRQTHAHTQHAHARICCCTRQHMQTRHSHDRRTRAHTQHDNTHVRRTRARPYSPTNAVCRSTSLISELNLSLFSIHRHTNTSLTRRQTHARTHNTRARPRMLHTSAYANTSLT